MRELLLAFILALVLGSIINGMQLKPNNPAPTGATQNTPSASSQEMNTNAPRHDFPDFASFANVNNDNFEQVVLKSQKPVFIDCYVPNNQACEQMIPLVAAVGKNHEDSIVMAKLNVMDNILLAHRYEVSGVPTFLLFDRGELKGKLSGVLPQDRLESMLTPQSSSNGVPQ
jgi:thioredoxin 1